VGSGEPGGADGQPARPDTHTARRLVRAATGERALTSVAETTRPAIAGAAKPRSPRPGVQVRRRLTPRTTAAH
jgi:hypothetical protein